MHYPDTSLLVAAMTIEVGSAAAQAWLDEPRGPLLISDWTITEVTAALAMKARLGSLAPERRRTAAALFERMIVTSLTVVPVTAACFRTASRFADITASNLRAGDALHLAIAASHGATVHTFDKAQAAAGPIVGVATHLIA